MHPYKDAAEKSHDSRLKAYRTGGRTETAAEDKKSDERLIEKGVHEHEAHLHKGAAKTTLKFRHGGAIPGQKPHHRGDRKSRAPNVAVVVHTADHAGRQQAAQQGMQQGMRVGAALGARAAASRMAGPPQGAPPPMGPPPGGPPMGGPPGGAPRPPMAGPPGGMMADGGAVKVREHVRRKAGGRV